MDEYRNTQQYKDDHEPIAILTTLVGSHMWGTTTPTSDRDTRTIVMTPLRGTLDPFHEVKPAKQEQSEGQDCTYYELRHFARLVAKGNPTFMESLFTPHYSAGHTAGRDLRQWRRFFVGTDEVYHAHRGFAGGQLLESKKEKPARPRGKLLSSSILGLLQAIELIQSGDVDLGTVLRDSSRQFPYKTRQFHIDLKMGDERHDEAMRAVRFLLDHLDLVYNTTQKLVPNYAEISDLVYEAYTNTE